MTTCKMILLMSSPVLFAAEASVLFVVAQIGEQLGVKDPQSMTVALIAGFTGMLLLQTWIIKYLLQDYRKTIENNTEAVRELIGARRKTTLRGHDDEE